MENDAVFSSRSHVKYDELFHVTSLEIDAVDIVDSMSSNQSQLPKLLFLNFGRYLDRN